MGLELINKLLELFVNLGEILQVQLHLRIKLCRWLREVSRLALISVSVAARACRTTRGADHGWHLILVAAGLLIIVLLELLITFFVENLFLFVHNVVLAIVKVVEADRATGLHQ